MKMSKIKILMVLLFIIILFVFTYCNDTSKTISPKKRTITETFYKKWDFEINEGITRIARDRVFNENEKLREKAYYVKRDIQGRMIIKGFIYKGKKQDFWTYYNTQGEISKIEFYNNDVLTQTINY